MNWYKDNKDAWKEIIETVAAERHRSTQMVEKDTIQSMFLQRLSVRSSGAGSMSMIITSSQRDCFMRRCLMTKR